MSLGYAKKYADAIQNAGGRVKIQNHGLFNETVKGDRSLNIKPLENFVMCPQCGHKQLKTEACVKCAFVLNEE